MKKNLLILVLLLVSLNSYFAQETATVASVVSKSAFLEGKTTGKFKITLPASSEKEDVQKSASYYVHNFTVNFDNATKVAEVTMVTNDERSRQIIVRFLSACGVQQINMEGTMVDLYPFYETYLK
jgi:hypothetical protein